MNIEDAQQRWAETILRVNGVPTYVERVESGGPNVFSLLAHTSVDGAWQTRSVVVTIAAVDESVPELGNRQINHATYYFTRKATHQWKRGLVPRQLIHSVVGDSQLFPHTRWSIAVPSPASLAALYNTDYPPMMQAVREVAQGNYLSRAFSRDLSVGAGASRWPILYYTTRPVGLVKGDIVELAAPAACLRELIQEQSPLRVTVK